jgi:D-beta-D-heptose 7-phosphate kinase / D-beta-D-heptose 1-phosphate adenosyltransferase
MDDRVIFDLLDSFHRRKILVLGDVMLDRFIYGSVERISPEAPIPVLSIERVENMLGGAANVARNIATLGAQAILIGVVGDDASAAALRAEMACVPSIDPRLIVDPARPTTLKTRHVANNQQILRADSESREPIAGGTAEAILEQFAAALPDVDGVILSDYAKGTLTDAVTQEAIVKARAAGKPVLVDPKSTSLRKYDGATVLTPNRHELQLATGSPCTTDDQVAAAAADILAVRTCAALVVTRGKDGMSVFEDGCPPVHLRTVAREVFDVSGAGDTAIACLALGISSKGPAAEAARLANVAAGIVVGKYGTASVTPGEIVAWIDQSTRGDESAKNFSLTGVMQTAQRWRELGLRVAFTNGCFDLLHPGHVSLLQQARCTADRLIVGLNSDLSVRRLKGPGRPVQSEVARATVLASLKFVDAVVIFEADTPLELIELLQPDVLVKGADYSVDTVVGADLVLKRGGRVVLAHLVPAQSTTNTIRRVVTANES